MVYGVEAQPRHAAKPPAVPSRRPGAMHSSACEAMLPTFDMQGTVFLRSSGVFLLNSSSSNPAGVFANLGEICLERPWPTSLQRAVHVLLSIVTAVCCKRATKTHAESVSIFWA